jgi:hypothetical protein
VPDALGGTRRASHSGREHRGGALGARTDSIRREPVRSGDPGTCREPDCFAAGAVICCNSVKEKPGQSRALRRLSVIVVTSCRGTRDSIGGDRPAGHHRSSRDRRNSRQQGIPIAGAVAVTVAIIISARRDARANSARSDASTDGGTSTKTAGLRRSDCRCSNRRHGCKC